MNLKKYDGKRIRLKDTEGEVYEGVCEYLSPSYCMHEFGREEECLEAGCCLFFRNQIKKIEIIDLYSAPYGKLEEMNFGDGAVMIEEVLYSEEDESILRMLCLIDERLTKDNPDYDEIMRLIKDLLTMSENEEIKNYAARLIEKE